MLWQWWLYVQVWVYKGYDTIQNGMSRDPRRIKSTAEALTCWDMLDMDDRRDGDTTHNCDWVVVPMPVRPISRLEAIWRDIWMLQCMPTQIIRQLWIGNVFDACNQKWVQSLPGPVGIVNVTTDVPNFFARDGVEYVNFIVRDEDSANLELGMFEAAAQFIDDMRKQNGSVLVHCFVGRSRSVAICCYYLMTRFKRTFNDVYEQIISMRPIVQINVRFLNTLKQVTQDNNKLVCGEHQREGK